MAKGPVFGVLLVGFNRPTLFNDRLLELETLNYNNLEIFISVDGPRVGNQSDVKAISQIIDALNKSPLKNRAHIWISDINYGCDLNITKSISKTFNFCDFLLVIEDDIQISNRTAIEMLEVASNLDTKFQLSPVIGMSGIPWEMPFWIPRWRTSNYFSAWGYVVSKQFWEYHINSSVDGSPNTNFHPFKDSKVWNKMSKRRKSIWSERISRKNYDYAIQKTLFANNIPTIAPTSRVLNNEGHGIAGAAHTRFKAPWYLRRIKIDSGRERKTKEHSLPKNSKLLNWLDSQTWAGDGLLSVRGRTVGVRTLLKRVIKKVHYKLFGKKR